MGGARRDAVRAHARVRDAGGDRAPGRARAAEVLRRARRLVTAELRRRARGGGPRCCRPGAAAPHRVRAGSGPRIRHGAARHARRPSASRRCRGVTLGHRHIPVGSVGAYVPGGRYPMLASAFMTVAVPKVAGVERVVGLRSSVRGAAASIRRCCMRWRRRAPTRSSASAACRRSRRWRSGSCGLEPVDMVVGAGNAYVAEAKRQLFGTVGIDVLAGPTEVAVIADASRRPGAGRADLLGQAEHGPTSPALLISTSARARARGARAVDALLPGWPTREVAGAGLARPRDGRRRRRRRRGDAAVRRLRARAPRGARRRAQARRVPRRPAQLRLAVPRRPRRPSPTATRRSAPTTCCRRWAPRASPAGCGWASSSRRCTYQRLTGEGTRAVAPAVAAIAHAEHLAGHARTAEVRLEAIS